MKPYAKRYMRDFLLAMAAYSGLVVFSIWLLDQMPETAESVWRYGIAILPMLPLLFALAAFLRYLEQIDELQQRLQLQAISFAAGATGLITLTWGLLENTGLPHLSVIWVFPMMVALWGLAQIVLARRYA